MSTQDIIFKTTSHKPREKDEMLLRSKHMEKQELKISKLRSTKELPWQVKADTCFKKCKIISTILELINVYFSILISIIAP